MFGLIKIVGAVVVIGLLILGGKWVYDRLRDPLEDEFEQFRN